MGAMTWEVMTSRLARGVSSAAVSTSLRRSPPPPTPDVHVGALLREWRQTRRLSQFDLALEAEVSARHLSYVETGKSQPSRDMVWRLADALDVPLRERNALLVAAGYAPEYGESPLTTPEMAPVRKAIECILKQQEPYPALVSNRTWDVLATNHAAIRLFAVLRGGAPRHGNIFDQVFDPEDMRPFLSNWGEVAAYLIRHLHEALAAAPGDEKLRALRDRVLRYPDIPDPWRTREPGSLPLPLVPAVFRKGELELSFFSTLTTFGSPRDVTLDELHIECMFPMDEATAELSRKLLA